MDISEQLIERFSQERMDEVGGDFMFMGFTEDELIYLDGIFKTLIDLTEVSGAEPSMELHGMMCRMDEAVMEYYENEDEEEED